ncbi:MAG: hypothetical protein ACKVOK_15745, partial [Flavobacteriales bacterium]
AAHQLQTILFFFWWYQIKSGASIRIFIWFQNSRKFNQPAWAGQALFMTGVHPITDRACARNLMIKRIAWVLELHGQTRPRYPG